jgi:hypothetical protein
MKLRRRLLLAASLLCATQATRGATAAAASVSLNEPEESRTRAPKVEGAGRAERPEPALAKGETVDMARPEGETVDRARPEVKFEALAVPTPLPRLGNGAPFKTAYADVYQILQAGGSCARFYGEPALTLRAFNQLAEQFKAARLPHTHEGSRMSGRTSNMIHGPTGYSYRLFERAVINTDGPFYSRKVTGNDRFVPNVGSFEPATRAARALVLLHELGHLLKGPDGRWLLTDDGASGELSLQNTARVEEHCAAELRALGDESKPARRADDTVAAAEQQDPDER